ncbi:hypothetical protein EDC01DRAFT_732587 [Geopyxis carbonaria]|nr:hypothetical protein EDC01DRAFT_732587 [Geopyxis carbonaria]
MNWTGGRRARARQATSGSVHRQKAFFARVRAEAEIATFSSSPNRPEGSQFIQRRRAQPQFDIGEHAIQETLEETREADHDEDELLFGAEKAVGKRKTNAQKIEAKRRKLLENDDWVCTKVSEPLDVVKKRKEKGEWAAEIQATRTRDPKESFNKQYRRAKEAHKWESEQYKARREQQQPPVSVQSHNNPVAGEEQAKVINLKHKGTGYPVRGPMDRYLSIFRAASKHNEPHSSQPEKVRPPIPQPAPSVTTATEVYSQYPTTGYRAFRELSQDGYIKIGREQQRTSVESEADSTQDTMLLDVYDKQNSVGIDDFNLPEILPIPSEPEPSLPTQRSSIPHSLPPTMEEIENSSDQLIQEIKELVRFKMPISNPMPSSPPLLRYNEGSGTSYREDSDHDVFSDFVEKESKPGGIEGEIEEVQNEQLPKENESESTQVQTSLAAYASSSLAGGDPTREPPPTQLNERWRLFTKAKSIESSPSQSEDGTQATRNRQEEANGQQSGIFEDEDLNHVSPPKDFEDEAWRGFLGDSPSLNDPPSPPPPPPPNPEEDAWKEFVEQKPPSPKPMPLKFTEDENRAWQAFVFAPSPLPSPSPSPSPPPRVETPTSELLPSGGFNSPARATDGISSSSAMISEVPEPRTPAVCATSPHGAMSMVANAGSSSEQEQEQKEEQEKAPKKKSIEVGAMSTIAHASSSDDENGTASPVSLVGKSTNLSVIAHPSSSSIEDTRSSRQVFRPPKRTAEPEIPKGVEDTEIEEWE